LAVFGFILRLKIKKEEIEPDFFGFFDSKEEHLLHLGFLVKLKRL